MEEPSYSRSFDGPVPCPERKKLGLKDALLLAVVVGSGGCHLSAHIHKNTIAKKGRWTRWPGTVGSVATGTGELLGDLAPQALLLSWPQETRQLLGFSWANICRGPVWLTERGFSDLQGKGMISEAKKINTKGEGKHYGAESRQKSCLFLPRKTDWHTAPWEAGSAVQPPQFVSQTSAINRSPIWSCTKIPPQLANLMKLL